jgi:hypothetical protein
MTRTTPTVEDVERISALADPVVRNLQITQCYHELSAALAARLGGGANWCTFATWASKQAGQTIRRQDVLRTFERVLGESSEVADRLNEVLQRFLRHSRDHAEQSSLLIKKAFSPAAKFDRTSDAVARGNLKVFAEVGREFARFLNDLDGTESLGEEQIERFVEALHPGEPPDGQRFLAEAFGNYHRASVEDDEQARAQLMLLANLEIGLHEQTRLQPEIVEALHGPVVDIQQLRRDVLEKILPERRAFWQRVRDSYFHLTAFLDRTWGRIGALVRSKARLAITRLLSTLQLPGEALKLGQDLRAEYPPGLRDLSNSDLVKLVAQFDRAPGSARGSGADDWGDLDQRMHFITELFRSHHDPPRLFEAPFEAGQVDLFKTGRLPTGDL